jgi:REP-associated tyrosine transposase
MKKFKNKYRIGSNRKPGWDYSGNGAYFITLVVQYRNCIFGEIRNNKVCLSAYGKIANEEWLKSFEIRNELLLDEYVIMPKHLLAIVVIKREVETKGIDKQYEQTNQPKLYRKPKSISSFMAGYKIGRNH